MGLLKNLLKTAVDVVTLPIDVATDVVESVDGLDPKAGRTLNKLGKIVDDVADLPDVDK